MDEDFDIYGDLSSIHENENELGEEKESANKLKEVRANLEKELDELKSKLEKLESQNSRLKINFSSLIKTAKAEIIRKDRTITDLRTKLDNFTFRRNLHTKVEPSLPPPLIPPVINPLAQFQDIIDKKFSYPPPSLKLPFNGQHANINQFSFPPPPITFSTVDNNHEMRHVVSDQCTSPDEEFIDTESKSDSEDIKVKQECPKTLYGERLRKKLLKEQEDEKKQKEAEPESREESKNNSRQQEDKKIESKQDDVKQQDEQNSRARLEEDKRNELRRPEDKKTESKQQEEKRNEIRPQEEKEKEQRYRAEINNKIRQHEAMKNVISIQEEEKKNEIRTLEEKRNEIKSLEEHRNKIRQEEDKKNECKQQEEEKAEHKKEEERRSEIRRQEDKKRELRYQEELKNRIKQEAEEKNEIRRREEKKNQVRKQKESSEMRKKEELKNKTRVDEENKDDRRKDKEKHSTDKCDINIEEKSITREKSGEESSNENDVKAKSGLANQANNKENHHSFVNESMKEFANNCGANKTSDLDRIPNDLSIKKDTSSFDEHIGTIGSHTSRNKYTKNVNYDNYYDSLRYKDYKNMNHTASNYADDNRCNDTSKNYATDVSHRHSRRDMCQTERDQHRNYHKSSDRRRSKSNHHMDRNSNNKQRSQSNHHTHRNPSYKQTIKSNDRINRNSSSRRDRYRSRSTGRTKRSTSDKERSSSTNRDLTDGERDKNSNQRNRDPRIKQDNYVQNSAPISTPKCSRDQRIKQDDYVQDRGAVNSYHCNRDPRIKQDNRIDVNFHHHRKDDTPEDRTEEKTRINDDKVKSLKHRKRSKSEDLPSPRKKRRKDKDFIESMFSSEAYEVSLRSDNSSAKSVEATSKEKTKNDQQKPVPVIEVKNKNELKDRKEILTVNGLTKDSIISNKTKQESIVLKSDYTKDLQDLEEGEILDSQQSDCEDEENLNNRLKDLKNQLANLEDKTRIQENDKIKEKCIDQQAESGKSTKIVNLIKGICKPNKKEKQNTILKNQEEKTLEKTLLYSLLTTKDSISHMRKNTQLSATKSLHHDFNINKQPIDEKSTLDKPKSTKLRKRSEEKIMMKPDVEEDQVRNDHSTKIKTSIKTIDNTAVEKATQKPAATKNKKIKEIVIAQSTLNTAHSQVQKNSNTNNEIQHKVHDDVSKIEDKNSCLSKKLVEIKPSMNKEDDIKCLRKQEVVKNNYVETNKKAVQNKNDNDEMKQENKKSCPTKNVVNKKNAEQEENVKSPVKQDEGKSNNCTKQNVKVKKSKSKKTQPSGTNRTILKKQPCKLLVDSEILGDAVKTIIPKSELGKNVIIIRRHKRPVQLADSPAVLVVKNDSLNKS